jgi:hypothetical protein
MWVVCLSLALALVRAQVLQCGVVSQHIVMVETCNKLAVAFDAALNAYVPVAGTELGGCLNELGQRVGSCAALPQAAGKQVQQFFSARTPTAALWACDDAARLRNCTKTQGHFIDCFFYEQAPSM